MRRLRAWLDEWHVLVADGATGTMLQARGLEPGGSPELWVLERPEEVAALHRAYVEAGAQIILTDSFGGSRLRLEQHGSGQLTEELNQAAARLAREAAGERALVAGDIGPSGQLLEPWGSLACQEAVEAFAQQAQALAEGGVDLFHIETMSDLREVEAAVEGIGQVGDFEVICTMTFDLKGRTMMGVSPADAARRLTALGVTAVGANCGTGPAEAAQALAEMHAHAPQALLVAKPNAGIPVLQGDSFVYTVTPGDIGQHARRLHQAGARIIGTCCGSTPDHTREVAQTLRDL